MRLKNNLAKHRRIMLILFSMLLLMLPSTGVFSENSELQEYRLLWSCRMNSTVKDVSISADGKYIAVAYGDKVCLLNSNGKLLWNYTLRFDYEIIMVQISGNGKYVIAFGRGWGIFYSDFLIFSRDGNILYKLYLSPLEISFRCVSISDEGNFIILSPGIFKYLISDSDHLDCYSLSQEFKWQYKINDLDRALISSDGNYIAFLWHSSVGALTFKDTCWLTLLNKNGEKLWDNKIGFTKCFMNKFALSISTDGSRIALAGNIAEELYEDPVTAKLFLLDINGNRKLLLNFNMSWSSVDVSISPDGNYVVYSASNSKYHSFLIVNANDGKWRRVAKIPASCVAVSSDADYVAAGYEDKVLLFAKKSIYAAKALEMARSVVSGVGSKGFSVKSAEDLLSQAQAKFEAGLYDEAIELAGKACRLATDINQDGVLNEEDFAPYVNNSLINAGIFALFITLALACYAYLRYRRGETYVFDKEEGTLTSIY